MQADVEAIGCTEVGPAVDAGREHDVGDRSLARLGQLGARMVFAEQYVEEVFLLTTDASYVLL